MADNLKIIISADMKKAQTDLDNFKKKVQKTQINFGDKGIKSTKSVIDDTTKSLDIMGKTLLDNISKFSRWYLIGNLVAKTADSIRELTDNVKYFDDSLTTMSFTIDLTDAKLNDVADATIQFAQELGTTGKQALEAAKIFTNLNSSIEQIIESSKDSVILSNLGKLDIEESSDALQSLQNQFRLSDEEARTLVDTLTFISANLKLDFSRGIKEISAGISNSGQTARDAGLNVNEYVALLGKSVELSRRSGSSLSSGMRTIISRIRRVKELSKEEISDLEAVYNQAGITIRKSETEFKSFAEIMDELVDAQDRLSAQSKETTLQLIAEQSAGIRQADTFRTMLSVWRESRDLAVQSADATGYAQTQNEKFIESIAGQKKYINKYI